MSDIHFANALVHIRIFRQQSDFAGRELNKSRISLLRRDLCFDDIDLLLGLNSTGFDVVDQLPYPLT